MHEPETETVQEGDGRNRREGAERFGSWKGNGGDGGFQDGEQSADLAFGV